MDYWIWNLMSCFPHEMESANRKLSYDAINNALDFFEIKLLKKRHVFPNYLFWRCEISTKKKKVFAFFILVVPYKSTRCIRYKGWLKYCAVLLFQHLLKVAFFCCASMPSDMRETIKNAHNLSHDRQRLTTFTIEVYRYVSTVLRTVLYGVSLI